MLSMTLEDNAFVTILYYLNQKLENFGGSIDGQTIN